jgi:hypothetical protein
MTRYTITHHDDGHFSLVQADDSGNVWPTTEKATARQIVARLSQLLEIGPVAPQTTPEEVCIGQVFAEGERT